MINRKERLRRFTAGGKSKANRSTCRVEPLEGRTLLSGWATVDTYTAPGGTEAEYYDVAADAAGNVYAVGDRWDSVSHGIVREKPAGSTTWTTLLDYASTAYSGMGVSFNAVAVSPAGDLYVSGSAETAGWVVLERPAGQSGFAIVDQVPPGPGVSAGTNTDLAVDAAGDVFAVGDVPVQVTVKSSTGKTTTHTERRWTVRERAAGAASFSTVDQFVYSTNSTADNYPYSVTAAPGGIYVVGDVDTGGGTPEHWVVRKSADGGATWKTVDDFQSDPGSFSRAEGVTADAAGNLYVTGETSQRYVISTSRKGTTYGTNYQWVVRKSADGGASWSTPAGASFPIPQPSSEAVGFGMGTDAAGNVYAVHPQYDSTGVEHSIIRSSAAGWQPVDDFQFAPGHDSAGFGFAAAPDGTLYAAGYGFDAAGVHGLVRSLAPATTAPAAVNAAAGTGDFADLLVLAQNYGKKDATFSDGDLNGDGSVDFADLLILAQRSGAATTAAGVVASVAARPQHG